MSVLDVIHRSSKEDLQNLGKDGLHEILSKLGISIDKCVWLEHEGSLGWWVPQSEADNVIRAINPGKTVSDKYVHNKVASGDVAVLSVSQKTNLYYVLDLLKISVWRSGLPYRQRKNRSTRQLSEDGLRNIQNGQYKRRARDLGISLEDYLERRA